MKTSLQQTTRTSQKTILNYTLAGVATVLLVGIGVFFFFNVGMSKSSYAATENDPPIITSIASGNWNAPTSWSLNRIPQNGDRVIINNDHRVTIHDNTDFNGDIIVNGELRVDHAKLNMDYRSNIAVNEGGIITFSLPTEGGFFIKYKVPTGSIEIGSIGEALFLGRYYSNIVGSPVGDPIEGETGFGTDFSSILPIELISFTANMTSEDKVIVRWSTAAENSNDYFTIERSLDGQNFFVLDTIQGVGDSNKRNEYTYTDLYPVSGYNYYRLKQTDFKGKFEYFNVVTVVNDKAESQLSQILVSPNPFFDGFEVSFYATDNSKVHLRLMDMQGRTVFNKSIETEKGQNSFVYNNDLLQPGVYLFTVVQKGVPAMTFRLVKSSHP